MDSKLISGRQAGVSLIELVVVVAVLAVLAIGLSLVPVTGARDTGAQDAARFEDRIEALRGRAIRGRQVLGLRVSAQQMQAVALGPEGWRDLGPPERWLGRATIGGAQTARAPGDPDILLLPTGRISPFTIQFRGRACQGGDWGRVSCGT